MQFKAREQKKILLCKSNMLFHLNLKPATADSYFQKTHFQPNAQKLNSYQMLITHRKRLMHFYPKLWEYLKYEEVEPIFGAFSININILK